MQPLKPARPRRARQSPKAEVETREVNDLTVETVVNPPEEVQPEPENKYAPKPKAGAPTIRGPVTKVTTVGLGNLTVETNGNRTYI